MLYTEAERRIFGPYHNGEKMVMADPLAVHRKLHYKLEGEPNRFLQDSRSTDQEVKFRAKERLLDAARFAFGMVPFNEETGQGALEEDVEATLRAYLEYMQEKKARGQTLPTCSQHTPDSVSVCPVDVVRSGVQALMHVNPLTTAPTFPYG